MQKINIFQLVKETVTAKEAAEYYGLAVNRNSMCICPFHQDKRPSMKLDERFYCFACQATGDSIDLVAKLFDIRKKEAAMRIASDFGLSIESSISEETVQKIRAREEYFRRRKELSRARSHFWNTITSYYHLLQSWKETLSPKKQNDEWNHLFIIAVNELPYLDYVMDTFLESTEEEQDIIVKSFEGKINEYEQRINQYKE